MIIEFSVENFRSINEKQAISFASTSDKTSKELLTVGFKKDIRINKLITFYGPNASGKSNMLRALYTVFALLFKPYFTICIKYRETYSDVRILFLQVRKV